MKKMHLPEEIPVRRGVRHILLIGLGSVLALLLTLGVYASRSLSGVSRAGTSATQEYFQRSELTQDINTLLWEATNNVRDYILDPDSTGLSGYQKQARNAWALARKGIEDYRRQADADSRPLADRLAQDSHHYWELAEQGLRLTGHRRSQQGLDLAIGKLEPARERVLSTIAEIGAHDRANLRTEAAGSAKFAESAERRLGATVGVIVVLALLVAGTTMFYQTRLEDTAVAQYQASLRANLELERLSRRLLSLQEDERQRIARELHDDYGQRMASLLFELSAVNEREDLAPEVRETAQKIEEGLRNVAKDLQQLSRSLHSAVLDKIGLEAAIRSDCTQLRKRAEWEISLESSDVPRRLPPPVSLAVYRVFQEALQNALKHAGIRRLVVSLKIEGEELVLRVKDFGGGFDTEAAYQRGSLGLVSMRERLRMVGGRLLIHSEIGKGTEIEARLPVPMPLEAAVTAIERL